MKKEEEKEKNAKYRRLTNARKRSITFQAQKGKGKRK
jgi:hypothetical protein